MVATMSSTSRSKSAPPGWAKASSPREPAADHGGAGHLGRRAAAIDAGAGLVAAVLAYHGHVMAGGDQLPQQVLGIDAHAADGGPEAARAEEDPHAAMPLRRAGAALAQPLDRAGIIRSARWLSRESSTQTRR
jgi:hypothetical protein